MISAPEVTLRPVNGDSDEMSELQAVFEACPDYFERVNGAPPGPTEALSTYTILPPGSAYEDKHVFAISHEGVAVGCIDLVRGYPDSSTAMLGLLLVGGPWQGKGVGAAAYRQLEAFVSRWPECARIRLGVVRTNESVLGFWHRMGFIETGEVKPYSYGHVRSEIVVLVKALPGCADVEQAHRADGVS